MNLKVAANFLKIFGITAVTCSSGRETIELLKKEKFDILFLDHMMPDMDGFETLEELKKSGLLNGTVVIALTANAVVGAEEQYLKAGFDSYLSKPVTVEDFEKTLKKYLPADVLEGKKDAEETASEPASSSEPSSTELTLDKASAAGLNVDEALLYTCGEVEFYMELLGDYARSCDAKCSELSSYLEKGDIANYEILVHSLKSSSKTIGAGELSEQAKALETAARNKDTDFIKANHGAFIKSFKELAGKILA